jgi:putative membrane protein
MPYYHMMDYMMDWFPFMGFGSVFFTLISLAVAYLVYKDAEKRGMNGLLWGLPILIPWVGILFLILYLILRDSGHRIAAIEKTGPESSAVAKTTAEELLDERYAKGEVDRETYLRMKEDLKKSE